MDEFGAGDIEFSAEAGGGVVSTEISSDVPAEIPEDVTDETPDYDYQAIRDTNPFAFAAADAKATQVQRDYPDLIRWQPRDGADEFGEDVGASVDIGDSTIDYAEEPDLTEDVVVDDVPMDEAADYEQKFNEDYDLPESAGGEITELSEIPEDCAMASETDETMSDSAENAEGWPEGEEFVVEHGVDEDTDTGAVLEDGDHEYGDYETSYEKNMTTEPETVGEMPPAMSTYDSGWDELKDVPFAGDQSDQHEIIEADDIPAKSIDDVGTWLSDVNPQYDPWDVDSPYSSNCGSCALAVERRLEGQDDAVATDSTLTVEEMQEQTGMEQVPMQPEEIQQYLIDQGPGSHAIVGIDRSEGPGHWFNAYYDGERVYALDGQTGTTEGWPPDYGDVTNWDVSVKKG